MKPQDVIARRIVKEVSGKPKVAVGRGIPEMAERLVPPGTRLLRLDDGGEPAGEFQIAVVEAAQVSQSGDLCLEPGSVLPEVEAKKWVVATLQTDEAGNPKIVRHCRYPVSRPGCVNQIITEKGVIEVTESGLVLREILPGVATDDIKKEIGASLHIADDLKLMEI